jgi:hypothetical protein
MNFHKDTGDSLEPCKHMESMLNRTAEGSAPKPMRWYALYHAAHCGRCGKFLKRVTSLIGQLHQLKADQVTSSTEDSLSAEQWEAMEARWVEAEKPA